MSGYNVESLRSLAADLLNQKAEYYEHVQRKPNHSSAAYGPWFSISYRLEGISSACGHALAVACNMVGAEQGTVIAVEKSIRRWEKHGGRYDRCIWSDSLRSEKSYRRGVAADPWAGCFRSTGRKMH